jgi:protein phosphatase 1 regulatory subunit 3A/B/C/D/E
MEMLVSHSPPIYSHSPPTGFLADFASRQYDSPKFCRPTTLSPIPLRKQISWPIKMPSPKRSCLVVRPEEEIFDDIEIETKNNDKKKKHVVFADSQGGQLEHIRIMREASCEPPFWSLQFLAYVTQGLISPVPTEQWTIDFRQPASDYLTFRRRIEENNCSLANVIIKESESKVFGTIKVKNTSFEKEVFVRSSWDNWKSQTDTYCTYTKIGSCTYGNTVYDTFSFKLTLPPNSRHLEFCVCYRANGQEYWDSNDCKNYILTNRHSPLPDHEKIKIKIDSPTENKKVTSPIGIPQKGLSSLSPWKELDSWSSNNADSTPYW